jgi:hypothetical protein
MARVGGVTNSANSQWFFNLANNSSLDRVDGGFTVFGRVIRGTNVLERFNNVSKTNAIFRINLGGPLDHLPLLSTNATADDLVYADISLLSVGIRAMADGSKQIFWASISNIPNYVEFTTNIAAGWESLASTNGTGSELNVMDSAAGVPQRFYRARVDF